MLPIKVSALRMMSVIERERGRRKIINVHAQRPLIILKKALFTVVASALDIDVRARRGETKPRIASSDS